MKKLFLLLTVMLATSMSLLAQGTSWQTATLINSGATKKLAHSMALQPKFGTRLTLPPRVTLTLWQHPQEP